MFLYSCSDSVGVIKNGDLLFRGSNANGLSEAIDDVTKQVGRASYNHVGICLYEDGKLWVYHASPQKGVCKENLDSFCKPDFDIDYYTDVFRVDISSKKIMGVLRKLDVYLNLPYDSTYIIDNEGYYCSELIYEIFKGEGIFKLNPMTFKDPNTGLYHNGWVDHYNNLNIEIPEGLPGCNPNDMSNNEKLKFVTRLH